MKKLIAWLLLALAFFLTVSCQALREPMREKDTQLRLADAAEELAREATRFNTNFLEQQRLLLVWRDSAFTAMQDTVLALQARLALREAENRFLLQGLAAPARKR